MKVETRFRPIPLTILDVLAVFFPGLVWLILLCTLHEMIVEWPHLVSSPLEVAGIVPTALVWDQTRGPWVTIVISALSIGYGLKPLSMRAAAAVCRSVVRREQEKRGHGTFDSKFPYHGFFSSREWYRDVVQLVSRSSGVWAHDLPGSSPFSAAKRILRLHSPPLWEESERMEAEVRLTGGFLLAALFSVALSATNLVLTIAALEKTRVSVSWLVVSVIAAAIFSIGFSRLRLREVEYTYMNVLIAARSTETFET